MGSFCVVTGGSGSGKSAYAEEQIVKAKADANLYIATMMCFDEESRARVRRHRQMRQGKGFTTIERFLDLEGLSLDMEGLPGQSRAVLLECMSNLAANEMFDPAGSGKDAAGRILAGIERLRSQCDTLVVVTNEIFSDGIDYDESTKQYQQILGKINCEMARMADRVVEVVYGIPVVMKS